MDKILLSIKSLQQIEDEDDGFVEFITEGVKYEKDGNVVLEYEDNGLSGHSGTKTSIMLDRNRVVMERLGLLDAQFVFEKGRKFESSYDTPFGNIKMDLYPTHVSFNMGDACGNLELEYELSLQDAHSFNKLWLSYRKMEMGSVN